MELRALVGDEVRQENGDINVTHAVRLHNAGEGSNTFVVCFLLPLWWVKPLGREPVIFVGGVGSAQRRVFI